MRIATWMGRTAGTLLLTLTLASPALAQGANTYRVRGVIERATADSLVVKAREGDSVAVRLGPDVAIAYPVRLSLADMKPGSYIGAAALPQLDGSLKAIAITVFPEAQRGVGEGHRAFDFLPESTMTNATVASAVEAIQGDTLRLTYKGGEKTLVIPPDTPIVTYAPGERTDLLPGAAVSFSVTRLPDGGLSVTRVLVAKNGVAPPY